MEEERSEGEDVAQKMDLEETSREAMDLAAQEDTSPKESADEKETEDAVQKHSIQDAASVSSEDASAASTSKEASVAEDISAGEGPSRGYVTPTKPALESDEVRLGAAVTNIDQLWSDIQTIKSPSTSRERAQSSPSGERSPSSESRRPLERTPSLKRSRTRSGKSHRSPSPSPGRRRVEAEVKVQAAEAQADDFWQPVLPVVEHCPVCYYQGDEYRREEIYGLEVCRDCNEFFKAAVQEVHVYSCDDGNCGVTSSPRKKKCRFCWLSKCYDTGMKGDLVIHVRIPREVEFSRLPEEEQIEKKLRAACFCEYGIELESRARPWIAERRRDIEGIDFRIILAKVIVLLYVERSLPVRNVLRLGKSFFDPRNYNIPCIRRCAMNLIALAERTRRQMITMEDFQLLKQHLLCRNVPDETIRLVSYMLEADVIGCVEDLLELERERYIQFTLNN